MSAARKPADGQEGEACGREARLGRKEARRQAAAARRAVGRAPQSHEEADRRRRAFGPPARGGKGLRLRRPPRRDRSAARHRDARRALRRTAGSDRRLPVRRGRRAAGARVLVRGHGAQGAVPQERRAVHRASGGGRAHPCRPAHGRGDAVRRAHPRHGRGLGRHARGGGRDLQRAHRASGGRRDQDLAHRGGKPVGRAGGRPSARCSWP